MIEPYAGYPAGMPRMMTVDLTGKLSGQNCIIRIKTNMECYYDQAFIIKRDRDAETSLRVRALPVTRARLGYRGYTREISPDGKQPLIYDYNYVDPAPLASFRGKLTRHGDVTRLLEADDDQLCLIGPGDEVQVEFPASDLPPPPSGWTAAMSSVESVTARTPTRSPPRAIPPYRSPSGMPAFPFGRAVTRPHDPAYDSYLQAYQTRPAGAGAVGDMRPQRCLRFR